MGKFATYSGWHEREFPALTAVPTAAPTAAAVAPRERLLDAAALLFYQEGVHAGVEALCRAAGVSKRSMYQLFTSKDDVLAASLERAALTYWEALSPRNDGRAPRARILHVFEQLEALSGSPTYRGCPLVATAVELKDPEHPASAVARRFKDGLTNYFHEEALRAGCPGPETAREPTHCRLRRIQRPCCRTGSAPAGLGGHHCGHAVGRGGPAIGAWPPRHRGHVVPPGPSNVRGPSAAPPRPH